MKSFASGLLLFLAFPACAFAHGLSLRVDHAGQTVTATASFDGDDPADDCVVTVTAADGTVIAKGPTDKSGSFPFPTPPPGTYAVVADAGAGHLARKTLTVAPADEPNPPAGPDEPPTNRWRYLGLAGGLFGILTGTAVLSRRAKRT